MMAESGHGIGSAIMHFAHNAGRTLKGNQIVRNSLLLFAGSVIIGALFCIIKQYANAYNCGSVVWDYVSEAGIVILGAFIGLAATLISCIDNLISKKREHKKAIRIFGMTLYFFSLAGLCLLTFFKVKGTIEKKEEEMVEKGRVVRDILMQGREVMQLTKLDKIIPYDIDLDLYMDNNPLDMYYEGVITDKNVENVKAQILMNNLEINKPAGGKSTYYVERTERADFEYETYLFQKQYTNKMQNDSEEWFERRMISLQNSLDEREKAEMECHIPENERPLAAGYKDKGDEYFGKKRQGEAMEAYEESAEWNMKAIYHAAALNDFQEMNRCMSLFKEMGEEVKKLEKIDLDRRNKIETMIKVYEKFVDLINTSVD